MAARGRQVEAQITEAVANKNWARAAELCENWELEASNLDTVVTTGYAVHLFIYLIQNDLNNARFLWKRIPADTKKAVPELVPLWRVGQSMWNRNYAEIYSSLAGYTWSPAFAPLVFALAESVRNRAFALLSKSYTNISVEDAGVILGLNPADTISMTTKAGWSFDQASNRLIPKTIAEPKVQTTGIEQLRQLTDYVVYLEQQ